MTDTTLDNILGRYRIWTGTEIADRYFPYSTSTTHFSSFYIRTQHFVWAPLLLWCLLLKLRYFVCRQTLSAQLCCILLSLRRVASRSLTLLIHKGRSTILPAAHVRFHSLSGITTLRTCREVQTNESRQPTKWFQREILQQDFLCFLPDKLGCSS